MKTPRQLMAAYFDDALDDAERAEFTEWLKADEAHLREFVVASVREQHLRAVVESTARARPHSTQGRAAESQAGAPPAAAAIRAWRRFRQPIRRALLAAACVAFVAAGIWGLVLQRRGPATAIAWVGEMRDCRWVRPDVQVHPGDALLPGRRLELSAGMIGIRFASGAEVTLLGPAIFDVQSKNGGFLTLGTLKAVAPTPQSKGFTVRTRTARVVDVGTEFVTSAAADGQSRVDVTSGEVFVLPEGGSTQHRLRTGDALSIEAGRPQILVRIERGDGTHAFGFPTIEPPSDRDYADRFTGRASMHIVRGVLHPRSSDAHALLDGRGQTAPDSPRESVYFANNEQGLLLMDLGEVLPIAKVNTYSWHQHFRDAENRLRAVQKYTLYGYAGDEPPAFEGARAEAGWVQIARINSDEFFRVMQSADRPAQQACSIAGTHGTIGRYRYLLWEVESTFRHDQNLLENTFYAEFDVYTEPMTR